MMLLAGKQRTDYLTNGINSMETNCIEKDGKSLYICRCNIISATTQWYTYRQMMCISEFVKVYLVFLAKKLELSMIVLANIFLEEKMQHKLSHFYRC
jgi:hypothetical protein